MTDFSFYDSIPPVDRFSDVIDVSHFRRLPDDWIVAVTDVVGSTRAIAEGRYKAVNMAGAAAISALMNATGRRVFPFVFAGDGAAAALPGTMAGVARSSLAATRVWASEELGLGLRVGLMGVADIRAHGRDVLVARYRPAPDVTYAMFAGGGVSLAETALKAGELRLPPAPPGARPDLTGLSCRWAPIGTEAGVILSVLAIPTGEASAADFAGAATAILDLLAASPRNGHPVPTDGPQFRWPPQGVDQEAGARSREGSRGAIRRRIWFETILGVVLDRLGLSLGGFDARRYRRMVGRNSDFRKFDDGLRLTVDVELATAERLERLLADAEADGILRYGTSRQDAALMTCIVPSVTADDHMHFIDGAGGGYAAAAARLKAAEAAARSA
jgi:hypothetical protein